MGAGGKAYTSPKPSQDMERVSIAQALSSGLGEMQTGITQFSAVANMSIRGPEDREQIE